MCPHCGQCLIALEWEGVEVDYCPDCGGVWLDPGELEQITQLAGVNPGKLTEVLRHTHDGKAMGRKCPRCRRRLRLITVGESAPVELDRCPAGHGLWFDSGEIEKLIAQFEVGQEVGAVARFFAEIFRDRRKSNEKES